MATVIISDVSGPHAQMGNTAMYEKECIMQIIFDIVEEFNDHIEHKIDIQSGGAAVLFGHDGVLDSLGLVAFIVAVEQALEDQLGVTIALADERALSQSKSPFRTIETLTDYAVESLQRTI